MRELFLDTQSKNIDRCGRPEMCKVRRPLNQIHATGTREVCRCLRFRFGRQCVIQAQQTHMGHKTHADVNAYGAPGSSQIQNTFSGPQTGLRRPTSVGYSVYLNPTHEAPVATNRRGLPCRADQDRIKLSRDERAPATR